MSLEFSQAIAVRDNTLWKHLDTITIGQAISAFLQNLTFHTKRCYASGLRKIFSGNRCPLTTDSTLQTMALSNLENILDDLKHSIQGSEMTKQHACKVFISFTRFLERQTKGMIKKVLSKKGVDATFVKVREKASTRAMKMEEWNSFIKALNRISWRDTLIAKALFQGAKRLSEVLNSKIEDIDWTTGKIAYRQLKSKFLEKRTVIAYPKEFMQELRDYLDGRNSGFVFITRNAKPVSQPHIYRNFSYAAVQANLAFHVHPHMLRATAITLFMKMGYHSDDIMKISGHCDAKAVLYYDKTAIETNITEQVKLI